MKGNTKGEVARRYFYGCSWVNVLCGQLARAPYTSWSHAGARRFKESGHSRTSLGHAQKNGEGSLRSRRGVAGFHCKAGSGS
jgi:hypothetical protein